ncbi:hypothetical protein C4585_00375 [Candidatus Parcubacteria bacterium]|nr:MAG: hypothetical protein C4585_00375 [Candidatus Parcubacteria bacterium]
MRKDKHLAIEMRKSGKSYNEIIAALKIPKATLSDWFSTVDWSKEVKARLITKSIETSSIRMRELDRVRGLHLKRAYEEAHLEAREEFQELKYNPLFIAGLMLYWGEGDKRSDYATRLVNTDPDLIRLYVFFLKNACQIPDNKIKAFITIYPDLIPQNCLRHWAESSGLSEGSFSKCVVIQGRHKERRLSYGMCTISISSTYFKEKMREWLTLMPQQLMDRGYYENIAATRV